MRRKQSEPPYPDAPAHLSERCRALWCELGPTQAHTTQRRTILQAALESLDRAEEARQAIARDGMTAKTESTGALHVHPCVKVEKDAIGQFARLWALLGLESDDDGPLGVNWAGF